MVINSKKGGSMVYVMVLITFLGIMATGFLYMTEYSRRSVVNNRAYLEAQTTARSIHQSFCESVSGGTSEAMNTVWTCFAEDCEVVMEEYMEMAGDVALIDPAAGAGLPGDPGGGLGEAESWDTFLRGRLADKEYVIRGSTDLPDQVSADMILTALPLQGKATVDTTVTCNGYRFSMKGDILFNDLDGERLDLGGDVSVCRQGTGVYRYYGGS